VPGAHLKVHVEADAWPPRFRDAVVYLTSEGPLSGEVVVRLREGVAVTGCWPRWPDEMGERVAVWRITPYERDLGGRRLLSFGVRLELAGEARLAVSVVRWEASGGVLRLEAAREGGLRAVVGPMPSFRLLGSRGSVSTLGSPPARYVEVRGERVALEVAARGLVAGFLEYEPSEGELPFEVEVRGVGLGRVERVMVIRLPDLEL